MNGPFAFKMGCKIGIELIYCCSSLKNIHSNINKYAFTKMRFDASPTSIKMTLAKDPSELQISTYDSKTKDQYYYEFDREVSSASVGTVTDGFSVSVEIMPDGQKLETMGAFVKGMPKAFTFAKGAS